MTSENSGLSRRTLAKGAAWAAPAVVVAAAAPMVAASPVCLEYNFDGTNACKSPGEGDRDYHLVLKICNTCTTGSIAINFTVQQLKLNNGTILTPCAGTTLPVDISKTIAADDCVEQDLGWFNSDRGNPSTIKAFDVAGNLLFEASAPPQQTTCDCPV
jgi:hypothetical protein